jgi:hypothetical protein
MKGESKKKRIKNVEWTVVMCLPKQKNAQIQTRKNNSSVRNGTLVRTDTNTPSRWKFAFSMARKHTCPGFSVLDFFLRTRNTQQLGLVCCPVGRKRSYAAVGVVAQKTATCAIHSQHLSTRLQNVIDFLVGSLWRIHFHVFAVLFSRDVFGKQAGVVEKRRVDKFVCEFVLQSKLHNVFP